MALKIIIDEQSGTEKMFTVTERICTDVEETKVIGPNENGKLLAAPGQSIPLELAEKLGLVKRAPEKKEDAPAENKGRAPAEDKSHKTPAKKNGRK